MKSNVNAWIEVFEFFFAVDILKPIWFSIFPKTKAWLLVSPDQAPRALPAQFFSGIYPKTIIR